MKSLNTIQKTFRVFQILTKIATVFCIVGASFCAVGALCALAWHSGGKVFSIFGEEIKLNFGGATFNGAMAELLSNMVFLGVERSGDISNLPSVGTGIVLILASLIFRYGAELERGDQARITDGG